MFQLAFNAYIKTTVVSSKISSGEFPEIYGNFSKISNHNTFQITVHLITFLRAF